MAKKKKMPTFWKVYIVYVLLFIALAAAALSFLYKYMGAYETAGYKGALKPYISSLKEGYISESLASELDVLDENIKSREENIAFVKDLLADAGYSRVPGENGEGYETFAIYSNGHQLGKVKFCFSGETNMGFELWELSEESWDLSAFINSVSHTLPEGYTLKVGNASYSAGKDKVEYKALDYVYRHFADMPFMYNYESGKYLGEAEVKVFDAVGNELSEDQLTEQYFLNNCDEALYKSLAEFGELFVNRYVDFGALTGYSLMGMTQIMEPDTELWERITSSWGIMYYANTQYCNIHNLKINFCSELADNLYLIDVSYDTETKGVGTPVWDDNFTRVVARVNVNGIMKAVAMYNY